MNRTALSARLPHIVGILGALVAIMLAPVIAPAFGLEAPSYVVALGVLSGGAYALLAVCLVLTFRVSQIINFALPALGLAAMSFLPILINMLGLPFWFAFALILPIGFLLGALTDTIVVRRVSAAPRVVGVVATLGTAGVLASLAAFIAELAITSPDGMVLPAPSGVPSFELGPLLITPGDTALFISAPLLTIAIGIFLTRSRYGLAIRASASNPDNARMLGVSPSTVSVLAWGIAGVVITINSVFSLGNMPPNPTAAVLSPEALLPSLAAAAIARFRSFPIALIAGVVTGVLQQIMLWNDATAEYSELAMLIALGAALLFTRTVRLRSESGTSWVALAPWRPLPERIRRIWVIRWSGHLALAFGLIALIQMGRSSDVAAQTWTMTATLMVVALSATLVMSLVGELSLGQFAIAIVAAGASVATVQATGVFLLGIAVAAVSGALLSVLLAYPSFKLGGLAFAILSLAFAVAVPALVFPDGLITPQQPIMFGRALETGVPYFFFTVAVCLLCGYVAWRTWSGGLGRRSRAVRDNANAATAMAIRPMSTRLTVVSIGGALAGIAGATLLHSYVQIAPAALPVDLNIRVVLAVAMGGLGMLWGGPLGVLWLIASGVAQSASSTSGSDSQGQTAALAIYATALILILIAPGGVSQLLEPVRNVVVVGIARLFGVRTSLAELRGERTERTEPEAAEPEEAAEPQAKDPEIPAPTPPRTFTVPRLRTIERQQLDPQSPILTCTDLRVSYGAVNALDEISLAVQPGEILGLIGPNGAGKTTLFEAISGFTPTSSGTITFAGQDITRLGPSQRAQLGLVRSFQSASLFGTLTAHEVLLVATERQRRVNPLASAIGIEPHHKQRAKVADEALEMVGLTPFRDTKVHQLSTGTRRFLELAALTMLQPRVLLLDEPSSGIAQREAEMLGPVLQGIRDSLDLTLIVIEHDIPLVMSVSDRVLAMAEGRELLLGAPDVVRHDPQVIDAYLGTSSTASNRSDIPPSSPTK